MNQYIRLTGYYPVEHEIFVNTGKIDAIVENTVSAKSKGSVVYFHGPYVNVLETPKQVLELIETAA